MLSLTAPKSTSVHPSKKFLGTFQQPIRHTQKIPRASPLLSISTDRTRHKPLKTNRHLPPSMNTHVLKRHHPEKNPTAQPSQKHTTFNNFSTGWSKNEALSEGELGAVGVFSHPANTNTVLGEEGPGITFSSSSLHQVTPVALGISSPALEMLCTHCERHHIPGCAGAEGTALVLQGRAPAWGNLPHTHRSCTFCPAQEHHP